MSIYRNGLSQFRQYIDDLLKKNYFTNLPEVIFSGQKFESKVP